MVLRAGEVAVNIEKMLKTVKEHPHSSKMGMIASHLGLVRETSLKGDPVTGIHVRFDRDVIETIIRDTRKCRGLSKSWWKPVTGS